MALPRAASGELIELSLLGGNLSHDITKTLYKSESLEVFRMVLLAGKVMSEHSVPGDLTIQCLEGQVEFTSPAGVCLLRTGSLVCLAGGEAYALKAVEDASVLVTLLLKK